LLSTFGTHGVQYGTAIGLTWTCNNRDEARYGPTVAGEDDILAAFGTFHEVS
jgi:hypothetical protein